MKSTPFKYCFQIRLWNNKLADELGFATDDVSNNGDKDCSNANKEAFNLFIAEKTTDM